MVINSELFGNLAIIGLGIIVISFMAYLIGRMFGVGVGRSLLNIKSKKEKQP